MTKAELIDAVAKVADVSKADAERTLGAFFDQLVDATKTGDKVAWPASVRSPQKFVPPARFVIRRQVLRWSLLRHAK
jgi:hypothetical protein